MNPDDHRWDGIPKILPSPSSPSQQHISHPRLESFIHSQKSEHLLHTRLSMEMQQQLLLRGACAQQMMCFKRPGTLQVDLEYRDQTLAGSYLSDQCYFPPCWRTTLLTLTWIFWVIFFPSDILHFSNEHFTHVYLTSHFFVACWPLLRCWLRVICHNTYIYTNKLFSKKTNTFKIQRHQIIIIDFKDWHFCMMACLPFLLVKHVLGLGMVGGQVEKQVCHDLDNMEQDMYVWHDQIPLSLSVEEM